MKLAYLSGCLALLMATTVMVTTVMAEDPLISLFDFTGAGAAREWQAVNDGVMGGVSETPQDIRGSASTGTAGKRLLLDDTAATEKQYRLPIPIRHRQSETQIVLTLAEA